MWEFKAVAVTYNKNSEVFVGLSESNFVHFNLSDSHNQNAGRDMFEKNALHGCSFKGSKCGIGISLIFNLIFW